MSLVPIFG